MNQRPPSEGASTSTSPSHSPGPDDSAAPIGAAGAASIRARESVRAVPAVADTGADAAAGAGHPSGTGASPHATTATPAAPDPRGALALDLSAAALEPPLPPPPPPHTGPDEEDSLEDGRDLADVALGEQDISTPPPPPAALPGLGTPEILDRPALSPSPILKESQDKPLPDFPPPDFDGDDEGDIGLAPDHIPDTSLRINISPELGNHSFPDNNSSLDSSIHLDNNTDDLDDEIHSMDAPDADIHISSPSPTESLHTPATNGPLGDSPWNDLNGADPDAASPVESISSRRQQPALSLGVSHAASSSAPNLARPVSAGLSPRVPPLSPLLTPKTADTVSPLSVGALSPSHSLVSPRLLSSPRFRTVPLGRSISQGGDLDTPPVDDSAPFESISLDGDETEDRPPSPLPTVPADPKETSSHRRKESWGGFGVDDKGRPIAHGVLPVHPDPPKDPSKSPRRTNGSGSAVLHGSAGVGAAGSGTGTSNETGSSRSSLQQARVSSSASGSSTPRRHAPPAHPHPFPIPTSPPSRSGPVPQVTAIPHAAQGLGVKGRSAFDKFLSRTRPQHLPPKDKAEDEEHLHQWESMMAKARDHDTERRKADEAKRVERERHLHSVTPRWEALLNNDFSTSKVRTTPALRQLWFQGIPEQLRGKAWALAIGNPLTLHKDAYATYLKRSKKALEMNRFPAEILEQMNVDLSKALVQLHVFQKGRPLHDDLKELLCAWVVYRSDEARAYAPHVAQVAAMLLLVSSPPTAFLMLVNLLSRPTMRAFYADDKEEIDAFYRVFENLQADTFPKIYANCKNLGLRVPESYFRSVLVEQVPFEAVCRLWDQIVLDGDGYIFRAALAIFGFLEPRLYYPDREEILSVLEGRNTATMAIAEREKERAHLRGEYYEEALDGNLSVFGLNESALFDWLAKDGWRDSRFERLVVRELPD